MAAVQRVWQRPGKEERPVVSWPPRQEGGDSSSRAAWHVSPQDKLWQLPEQSLVAFFSKVKMGASGQPQVRWHFRERLETVNSANPNEDQTPRSICRVGGTGVRSSIGSPQTTTGRAGLHSEGRRRQCPLELPRQKAELEMQIQNRLWSACARFVPG